jgi:hypothetical protein
MRRLRRRADLAAVLDPVLEHDVRAVLLYRLDEDVVRPNLAFSREAPRVGEPASE